MPAMKPSEACTWKLVLLAVTLWPVGTTVVTQDRSGRVRPVRVVIVSVGPLSVPSSEMKSPVTGRQAPPRRRSRTIMSIVERAASGVSIWRCLAWVWPLLATNMPEVAATARPMSTTPMSSSRAVKPAALVTLHFGVDRIDGDIFRPQRVAPADVDSDLLEAVGRGVVQHRGVDAEVAPVDG